MKKERQLHNPKPDEVFSRGPFSMARFGKTLIMRTNWPEDAFAKMQLKLVSEHPQVIAEIDQIIAEIAQLVSKLPAEQLLCRAWWQVAANHIMDPDESKAEMEDPTQFRMVDYVQSIVAAVQPSTTPHTEITESNWSELTEKVDRLFKKMNFDYPCHLSAWNKANDPTYNENFEEFKTKALMHWCNVRGARYQIHEPEYLRDVFQPHSEILKELFGLDSDQFIQIFVKIWHALSYGIEDAFNSLMQFQEETMNAIDAKISIEPTTTEKLPEMMSKVIKENGWERRSQDVFGRVFGTDLFDVQKVAALPQKLLDQLTWTPGEDTEFFSGKEYRGWPTRIWPVFKRPFINIAGRYYCFDLYNLLDHLYRVMQRIIFRLNPAYKEAWKEKQQLLSENLPFKYLSRILPGATIFQSVFYEGTARTGKPEWCETDGLLIYDDHLFIIECKGGAFTYESPATDFPSHIDSLRNLVLSPATQGKRFLDYLSSAECVPIFDRNRLKIGELRRKAFRQVTILPVTLDPLTELAAQVQHLRKIGIDVGAHPVWAVSLDDLRVYADVFDNPLIFLHYIEQRMQAFRSDAIQSDDELDHLGLYLEHNHYSTYASEMRGSSDARLNYIGYRTNLDKFFAERMADPTIPCPLKQIVPSRVLEIIDCLTKILRPGRAEIAGFLLDLDAKSRRSLSDAIDEELVRQIKTRRPKPLSMGRGVNLTTFCWTPFTFPPSSQGAIAHARRVLLAQEEASRLLLELTYDKANVLTEVSWHRIVATEIPKHELQTLRIQADELKESRISNAIAERGKIERNEKCPCGSGKKFKVCCFGK